MVKDILCDDCGKRLNGKWRYTLTIEEYGELQDLKQKMNKDFCCTICFKCWAEDLSVL